MVLQCYLSVCYFAYCIHHNRSETECLNRSIFKRPQIEVPMRSVSVLLLLLGKVPLLVDGNGIKETMGGVSGTVCAV